MKVCFDYPYNTKSDHPIQTYWAATSAIGEKHWLLLWICWTEVDDPLMKDYKTDGIVQQSLRHEVGKDVTIITVAHRLQTIMDADKIVRVLSNPIPYKPYSLSARSWRWEHRELDGSALALVDHKLVQTEYDSPAALLGKENGRFKSMVDGSGDRENLYAMVYRAEQKWRMIDSNSSDHVNLPDAYPLYRVGRKRYLKRLRTHK